MTAHHPGFEMVLILWQHFIKSSRCFNVSSLHGADFGDRYEVLVGVTILNVLQGDICSLVQVTLIQEVGKFEENLVTVVRLYLLVFCCNIFVVYDIYRILYRLGSKILWRVVFGLELVKFTHSFDFCDRKMLSG